MLNCAGRYHAKYSYDSMTCPVRWCSHQKSPGQRRHIRKRWHHILYLVPRTFRTSRYWTIIHIWFEQHFNAGLARGTFPFIYARFVTSNRLRKSKMRIIRQRHAHFGDAVCRGRRCQAVVSVSMDWDTSLYTELDGAPSADTPYTYLISFIHITPYHDI